MTPLDSCAVPHCPETAAAGSPLCVLHLVRVPPATCDALLAAWRVYELGMRPEDAEDYSRQLREVLRELALISYPHRPVQLRLVK